MATVAVRNSINNERFDVQYTPGKSVKDTVREAGVVSGDFSIRDKVGNVIDDQPINNYVGQVLNLGMPGATIVGG